ncbi:THAP domain-containing protein 1-like [Uloborus diversus]|uniref:THAP domain-containing protein 1-like n=1 Tax=Uloborus diversus TaxID=327109 RepID=UPI00240929C2|nr:THAP domain-containing protein 1-like [Uloborus diversus]
MVYTCCVPRCKGNYPNTPKVQLFSFPKDDELKRKWISAINRQDFIPTKYTKVCEQHFHDSDIRKEAECYDDRTGKKVTAPLKRFQLNEGAIPTIFPDCPAYMSSNKIVREDPEKRRSRIENDTLNQALNDSLKVQMEWDAKNTFD